MSASIVSTAIVDAAGINVSPMLIVALVAVALSTRGRAKSALYVLGCMLGVFAVLSVTALLANGVSSGGSGSNDTLRLISGCVLAALFAFFAVQSFRGKPKPGEQPKIPGWMAGLDGMAPIAALGFGALLSVLNGKNLPLMIRLGALLGAEHLDAWRVVGFAAVFAVGACLVPLTITVVAAAPSTHIQAALKQLKTVLSEQNWLIMSILFFLLLAIQLGHIADALGW